MDPLTCVLKKKFFKVENGKEYIDIIFVKFRYDFTTEVLFCTKNELIIVETLCPSVFCLLSLGVDGFIQSVFYLYS